MFYFIKYLSATSIVSEECEKYRIYWREKMLERQTAFTTNAHSFKERVAIFLMDR